MSARRSDSRSDVTAERQSRKKKKKTGRPKLVLFVIFCLAVTNSEWTLSEIDPDVVGKKIFVFFRQCVELWFGKRK